MKNPWKWVLFLAAIAASFAAGVWRSGRVRGDAAGGRKVLYWVDPMHPAYRSDKAGVAPDCGMRLEPVYMEGAGPASIAAENGASSPFGTVRVSPERQQLIGVRVMAVMRTSETRSVRLLGRVAPDETRVFRIIAPNDGWIKRTVPVTTGSLVKEGDLLATLYVPTDLLPVLQGYFLRLASPNRGQATGNLTPEQLRLGLWSEEASKTALRNFGLMDRQIEDLTRTRQVPEEIEVRTPVPGLVLARNVAPGQRFDKGVELYRIADLTKTWVLADLFAAQAQAVKPGLPVRVTLSDQGITFQGRVSPVKPQFDPDTRTLKVRIAVDNPELTLRPDMFVDVEFPLQTRSVLTIPAEAVLDSGLRRTVFVDRGNGAFEPRRVETGAWFGDRVEIVRGLMVGEKIVVSGNFFLDSESRMRAAALGIQGTPGRCVVCDMDVDLERTTAAGRSAPHEGRTYYFCSEECKREFSEAPQRLAGKSQPVSTPPPKQFVRARETGAEGDEMEMKTESGGGQQ